MTETVITVQGEFTAWYPAERATVHLTIEVEGPKRQPVFEGATKSAEAVRASITDLHDASSGPITWWSSDSVSVWSSKPWNNEGKQLPPVFHASINFTARFSDFPAMARWIEDAAAVDGVNIRGLEWALTAARETAVTAEVRSRAVKDAVAKASVYAQSIGLGTVRAIALADPGMLGEQGGAPAAGGYELMSAKSRAAARRTCRSSRRRSRCAPEWMRDSSRADGNAREPPPPQIGNRRDERDEQHRHDDEGRVAERVVEGRRQG